MIANRENLPKSAWREVIRRERARTGIALCKCGWDGTPGGLLDLGQEWEERRPATGDRRRPAIFTRQNSDPLLRELGERREAELIPWHGHKRL